MVCGALNPTAHNLFDEKLRGRERKFWNKFRQILKVRAPVIGRGNGNVLVLDVRKLRF
jgi:hypothetical protein